MKMIKRLIRHMLTLPGSVNRILPAAAMRRIEQAIATSERSHTGQIRFAVESQLDADDIFRKKTGRKRAIEVFSQLRVWDTEQNNGVLIYLLIADHDFEILADRGIHRHVGDAGWEDISHAMERMFRQGQFEAGVLHGITAIGQLLAKHYPANTSPEPAAQGPNNNELPDAPVIL